MPLSIHEFFHFLLSTFAALIVWRKKGNFKLIFLTSILAGFFVDIDHLFDYVIAFGLSFNLQHFLAGYQFLKINRLYIPLHAYEYIPLLLVSAYFIKKYKMIQTLFVTIALSLFLHLAFDSMVNEIPVKSYFITYRISKNFELKKLVTPSHYIRHQIERKKIYPYLAP